MNEPTKMNTPYVHGNSYSANYNGDVVKMHFTIRMARYDTGSSDQTLICSSESFYEGISVSSVSWGFDSPGATGGDRSAAKLSFTLHDIAGKNITTIMKLRTGIYWLYFRGPDSLGELWPGVEAIYMPIPEECNIEFSATQGFTYSIGARPIANLANSPLTATKSALTLTGAGDGIGPGSTFKDYLTTHFVNIWNEDAKEKKKTNAQIAIECVPHPLMDSQVVVYEKNEGGKQGLIEPFAINALEELGNAIRRLFFERFNKKENSVQTSKDGSISKKPTLEIVFKEWKGKKLLFQVAFIDDKDEKTLTNKIPVCIGSDLNCQDATYRAQLVSMDFGPLYTQMVGAVLYRIDNKQSDGIADSAANSANDDTGTVASVPFEKASDVLEIATNHELNVGMQKNANGSWGVLDAVLAKNNAPHFTIDIELPYAFGFTPAAHGGMLKDLYNGGTGAGIHYTQGVELDFWWYSDPNCSELVKQPEISTDWRIAKVIHTIGLNGNTTQVTLSILTIT